jgi:PilZ domain
MSFAPAEPQWIERRRHPRVVPPGDVRMWLPVVANADVLDLSVGGALISTSAALHPGQRAQLRVILDRQPFSAWVEVRRVETGTLGAEVRIRAGASFTSLDKRSEVTLRQFLRHT